MYDVTMSRTRELLQAAMEAAARGWPVFPLRPYSKQPAIRRWEQRASTDARQIAAWWSADPSRNIAVACGPAGLLVVDLDVADPAAAAPARHGWQTLADLAAQAGEPVPRTFTVGTASGGRHLYFVAPAGEALRNTAGVLGPRIDTRARGGYVVAATSLLNNGGRIRQYRVLYHRPAVPLPQWLAAALGRSPSTLDSGTRLLVAADDPAPIGRIGSYVAAAVAGEAAAVARAATGTRNNTLFRAAANLGELVGAGVLAEPTARQALVTAAAAHVGIDEFTETEMLRTIASGLHRGRATPRRISAE